MPLKDRLLNKSNALSLIRSPKYKRDLGMTPSTYAMVMTFNTQTCPMFP
jgi:hypothetical protein